MTTALEGDEGSASRPDCSLPSGKTRYPLYRRLGGPQGRSGQVRKISLPHPTGIRAPDRPARTQSLYRIRKPAHLPLLVEGNLNSLPSVVDPEMVAASPCESYCLFPTLKSVKNYSRPSTNPKILCLSTSMTRPGKIILAFVFAAYNRTLSVANTATVLRQYYYY